MRFRKGQRSKRTVAAIRFDVLLIPFGALIPHPKQDYFPKLKPLEPVRARAAELVPLEIRLLLTELTAALW